MVWVDEWRGHRVWSRLCVRQFKAKGLRDDLFAGKPDTFFIKYLLANAAGCKDSDYSLLTSVLHSCTLEQMWIFLESAFK